MITTIIPLIIMIPICIILLLFLSKDKKILIAQVILIVLLFVMNFRIMIPSSSNAIANNLDVLFVVDNTISMTADDLDGKTRLDQAKEDMKYIVDKLSLARFSLITFNHQAQLLVPFTNDINMIYDSIDIISVPDELYAKGTSLNIAKEEMENSLKKTQEKGRTSIVFFISDGEITNEENLASFKLDKDIDAGAVMGYGSQKGGYMKIKDKYTGSYEYIKDYDNYPDYKAISKIDEQNLKKIAKDMNISYVKMNKSSNIDNVLKNITKKITNETVNKDKNSYQDIYYIFAILILIDFTYIFIQYKRRS